MNMNVWNENSYDNPWGIPKTVEVLINGRKHVYELSYSTDVKQ